MDSESEEIYSDFSSDESITDDLDTLRDLIKNDDDFMVKYQLLNYYNDKEFLCSDVDIYYLQINASVSYENQPLGDVKDIKIEYEDQYKIQQLCSVLPAETLIKISNQEPDEINQMLKERQELIKYFNENPKYNDLAYKIFNFVYDDFESLVTECKLYSKHFDKIFKEHLKNKLTLDTLIKYKSVLKPYISSLN